MTDAAGCGRQTVAARAAALAAAPAAGPATAPASVPGGEGAGPVWHALPAAEVLRHLGVDGQRGLSTDGVQRAQARHGPNALPERPPRAPWRTFVRQFKSPLIYILFAAAVLAVALGHRGDALVILAVVLVNALIGTACRKGGRNGRWPRRLAPSSGARG